MDKWIEFGSKNGWALLLLIAIGYVIYKKVWPLLEKTWERAWALIEKRLADADAREKEHQQRWEEQGRQFSEALRQQRDADQRRSEEQGKLFTEALRSQNVFADLTHKETMKAHSAIAEKLEHLYQHIRNGNGK